MNPHNKKGRQFQRLGCLNLCEAATLVAKAKLRFLLKLSFYSLLYVILAILTFPAFFLMGCSRNDEEIVLNDILTKVSIQDDSALNTSGIRSLDVYVFNNDRYKKLDSYQRLDSLDSKDIVVTSRTGSKLIVIIANLPDSVSQRDIALSYEGLCGLNVELSYEDPSSPIMGGETVVNAGKESIVSISLSPFMSMIEIGSLNCEFESPLYRQASLENVQVYLTNVRNLYPFVSGANSAANSFINMFELSENDLRPFVFPQIIKASIPKPINSRPRDSPIRLFCYPNPNTTNDYGSPVTMLVIEGELSGKTCYYPIEINKGRGVERNMTYSYSITLTKPGVASPDTPIASSEANINFTNSIWEIHDTVYITF